MRELAIRLSIQCPTFRTVSSGATVGDQVSIDPEADIHPREQPLDGTTQAQRHINPASLDMLEKSRPWL
jgi:hypothetical protein